MKGNTITLKRIELLELVLHFPYGETERKEGGLV
jgi:hypothetical protein